MSKTEVESLETEPSQQTPEENNSTIDPSPTGLVEQLMPLFLSVPLLTLLTGVLFPVVLAAAAYPLFLYQANGSLIEEEGVLLGSELIGQRFRSLRYFHSRPSAAGEGYDALVSGGTNLGPDNPILRLGIPGGGGQAFVGVKELTEDYRRINGLPANTPVPIDAVTRSGSGLDPHISPDNAALQVPRVAREREMSEAEVQSLVATHTSGRQFGFLGQPRVAVLPLNLALDGRTPSSSARRTFRRPR